MSAESDDLRILRLHKTWADRYTLLWHIPIFMMFGGVYFPFDQSGIDREDRTSALVLLAATTLAAAIWQAVGLGVARVHMLLAGIDLDRRTKQ
jgi:hypothetical protein